jgi:hypothetical protein
VYPVNGEAYSEETLSIMIDATRQYIETPGVRDSIVAKCYQEIGLLVTGTPYCQRAEVHLTHQEVVALAAAIRRWQLEDEHSQDKSMSGMSQQGDGDLTFDLAIARYKQGRCPGCGKGVGEPRGLEYRRRLEDLYCHTCKRPCPVKMDARVLRGELALSEPPEGDISSFPMSGISLPRRAGSESTIAVLGKRLSNFFKMKMA